MRPGLGGGPSSLRLTLFLLLSLPPGDPKGVLLKHSAVLGGLANAIYYSKVSRDHV